MTADKKNIKNNAWVKGLKICFIMLLAISTYYLVIEMPVRHYNWPHWDKVQHLALFFSLTLLGLYLFRQYRMSLILLLLMYGALAEYYQSVMTRTRTGSVEDWLADLVGVCLAYGLFLVIAVLANRRQKRNKSMG